jgi:hypothetical protein
MIDKSKFKGDNDDYLTQGLFIEHEYNKDKAVYSIGEADKTYKGVKYPSLKRLYLEIEDPTEYLFSTTHLHGWEHWQRMITCNKWIRGHVEKWRAELEVKIRSQAVLAIIDQSADESKGFQAAKWLADRGWDKRAPGRPTKEEGKKEENIQDLIRKEFDKDIERMGGH